MFCVLLQGNSRLGCHMGSRAEDVAARLPRYLWKLEKGMEWRLAANYGCNFGYDFIAWNTYKTNPYLQML